ncbi:hypothetical protein FRX31_003628 [Thalictrum thalictroides]|uniref:F-box protein At3g26010-like beta-propeller domain-containing protein n=1 Tax=Thalictrum thalictroides TaxID=46969 RepID=A0A7J6XAY4_THATH|nr:hypothetical protein FRX31_003628 [Thalictrum thalictroides]
MEFGPSIIDGPIKCVFKRWQDIISDTSFPRLQCQSSKPLLSGFLFQDMFDESNQVKYVPFSNDEAIVQNSVLDFVPEHVRLFASSNGLICCLNFGVDGNVVFICNPIERKCFQLEVPKGSDIIEGLAFVFDPFCNSMDKSPSFKLVSITRKGDFEFSFHIYSSEIGEWRNSEKNCYCDLDLSCNDRGVFAGGIFYWMTQGNIIIAFDVEKEQSQCITLPVPRIPPNEEICEVCIGESEDSLHYIVIAGAALQVWVLSCDHKWALKHFISLAAMEGEYPYFFYSEGKRAPVKDVGGLFLPTWIEPIAFKDGFLLVKLRLHFSYKEGNVSASTLIYMYNPDAGTMEVLISLEEMGLPVGCLRTLPYCMSLAPMQSTCVSKIHFNDGEGISSDGIGNFSNN